MTTTGTNYFKDLLAVLKYYGPYGYNEKDVHSKLADGEIHIGKPALKPGETLSLIDDGTRYAITGGN